MTLTQTFYEIACMFPVMNYKGLQQGDIPGLRKDYFCTDDLAGFVYEGGGRAWSTGEKLVIELLLNLYSPGAFDRFNLGFAMNVWDMIEQEKIDRIKTCVDIKILIESRGISLSKNGKSWFGLCPFHDDKIPSLSVTPSKNEWNSGDTNSGDTIPNSQSSFFIF